MLQLGSKFDIHAAMALMVTVTLLLTSIHAFTFRSTPSFMAWHLHSMKKPLQRTTRIAPTRRCTQQILMLSIVNQQSRRYNHHSWQLRYLELKEFRQQHGHTDVPQGGYSHNPQLGLWVYEQRQKYKKGKLLVERIHALEDIGFRWDVNKAMWDKRYLELKEFRQQHGHTDVPQGYSHNSQLGKWVRNQRTEYKNGILLLERIHALEDIGFRWSVYEAIWDQRYLELKEFYQQFGHTDIPRGYSQYPQLGKWVNSQRTHYNNGILSVDRIQALEDIGFHWGSPNPDWEQRYLELTEFRQQHGHADVPRKYTDNPRLGEWVGTQRAAYKKGKLSAERIRALENIGFGWRLVSRNAVWKLRYLELKEFYEQFGHTDVPKPNPTNPQLRMWVHTQRERYRKGKLSAERIRALEDIGFHWVLGPLKSVWEKRYLELVEFHQKFGHTFVPHNYTTNPKLAEWVSRQRSCQKGKLSAKQIRALEDIGFHWDYTDWELMYLELKKFQQRFGHTNVPRNYPDNPELGEWVYERRVKYKNGKLIAEHSRALVDLDFKWEFRSG